MDGARHGIASHAPHALQASPYASPASHACAPHAGVHLGMLTPQAFGLPHALQPFGQPASGQLSLLAESAPSGASPNEVILGRHVPSPSASLHHDVGMPSPISKIQRLLSRE